MRIRLLLALALCALWNRAEAAGAPPPAATTIVNYDFNTGSSYGALTPGLASGITSVPGSTQPFNTLFGAATDESAFTSNLNGGRAVVMADASGTNTNYFEFRLSGTSLAQYRHYKVYVQAVRSATGATTLTLAYSTTGGAFTPVSPAMSLAAGTFVSQVFDLSSVTALDHRGDVQFRLMASGAPGTSSAIAIDNFQVQAEPVTCPSAFTIGDPGDTPDADPGDAVCADSAGACTLRAALMESNALATCSAGTLDVTARGTIALASPLPPITQPLTIQGPGANALAVRGNNTFRLLRIALAATTGAVTINDLAFTNGGKGAGDNAAAIEFNDTTGSLVLNRDEFYANSGPSGSSVIFSNAAAALNMTGSTVRNNAVEHVISIGNTPFTIVNSTIASNAGTGAAIYLWGAVPSATITGATITNNTQGLWHVNTSLASTVTIRNSIFSQNGGLNLRRTGVGTCANNGIVSGGFNLIDNTPGANLCSAAPTDFIGPSFDPQLSPLGYYGGTTQTRLPASTSPAIDKGQRFGLTTEQRGTRRTYDRADLANTSGGDGTDIGAVELGYVVNSLADTGDATADGACDNGSGVCTLREAIQEGNALANGTMIGFAPGLTGTIALGSALPTITRPVTILGPGANVLTVSGNDTFRLLNIALATPGVATINDLAFANGGKGAGENATAIEFNETAGALVLTRDEFRDNGNGSEPSTVIFSNNAAGLTMTASTVRDSAVQHVFSIGTTPFSIVNSTLANNTGTGAAIFLWGHVSSGLIASSTITGNANGLWHINTALASTVTIQNDIFAENSLDIRRSFGTCATAGIVSGGYNLIDKDPGDGLCVRSATDLIGPSFDPQLTPLGSYGGTTRTRALLAGSPAIDRGQRLDLTADQRGRPRPFDNTGLAPAAGGDNTDIGAFELQSSCGAVTVNPSSLPNWNTSVAYTRQLSATGAISPYSFTVVSGSLPPGVTMAPSGALSGTPTGTGTFTFTVAAASANDCYGMRSYTIAIDACTTIAVSPASVPMAVSGTAYSQSIAASGGVGPYTFTSTGTLPTGVTLSSAGLLSGTPLTVGAIPFSATATASNGCTGSQGYLMTVLAPPTALSLSGASVAENSPIATTVGTLFTADLDSDTFIYTLVSGAGSGDNASFAVNGSQLQTNAVFDFETKSSYSVRVRTTDPNGLAFERAFTIAVTNVDEPPTISDLGDRTITVDTTTGPLGFQIGDRETAADALTVTGTSSNADVVPNDPAHITFAGTGVARTVTITPAAHKTGATTISVTVSDGTSTAIDQFVVNVGCGAAIALGPVPAGVIGAAYSQAVAADGGSGSYTFAIAHGGMAGGLTLSSSGLLAGTPIQTGTFAFSLRATDTLSGCTGSRDYEMTVGDHVRAGQVVISEFRLRGRDPDGTGPLTAAANEFVEFANTTGADVVVSSNDTSAGWALVASDGAVRFIIPNGTTIPAHGHFLAAGDSYGLSAYPSGNDGSVATTASGNTILLPDGAPSPNYVREIPDGGGLALFRTAAPAALSDASNRLDAAGFAGVGPLFYEGTPLAPAGGVTVDVEHTVVRQLKTGVPQDTDQNRDDFLLLSPVPDTPAGARLGVPGPENTTSPIDRTAALPLALIDTGSGMSASTSPNRERYACGTVPSAPCGGPTQAGEMIIRRKITNTSADPITRLRFRIVDLTAYPVPEGTADLRVLSSAPMVVSSSSDGLVTVQGTVLEAPPELVMQGAGLNATLSCCRTGSGVPGERSISLAQPLAPGATIYLQVRLGVRQSGAFRFLIVIEALP